MKFKTLQIEIEPSTDAERALLIEAFDSAVDALEDRNKWPGLLTADGMVDQRNNLSRVPPRPCVVDLAQFKVLSVALDVMITEGGEVGRVDALTLEHMRSDLQRVWWEGA